MSVGFTGTRAGMTKKQKYNLRHILAQLAVEEFHHGDCVGADAEAHDIAEKLGCTIIIHPPIKSYNRAGKKSPFILPPKNYLDRNWNIVKGTETLIAAPKTEKEALRSGTWSTVRYARKLKRNIIIIYPSGRMGK